jgi:phosphoribosylglycinamide formyltransferase-1
MSKRKLRIAVLASGAGTTLQAVIDACEQGVIAGHVVVVIGNNSRAEAKRRAARHGIAFVHLSSRTHPDDARLDAAVRDALTAHDTDLVLLAGYMKKIGPATLAAFPGRIVNTHPSLLPKYGGRGMYGAKVHSAVLAGGESESGISVHAVDDDYDTGPVLAQKNVPVEAGDDVASLAARVQSHERAFLVDVLRRIAIGEIALAEY